jgi:hypothetical protein
VFDVFLFDILGISGKIGAHTVYEIIKWMNCKLSKCFNSKVATVSHGQHSRDNSRVLK